MAFRDIFGGAFRAPFGGGAVAVGATYISKVIGYSPIAYWPLNEAIGASAVVCQINPLQNGSPSNVAFGNTLGPDGVNNAPLFNGTNSLINVTTNTFKAAFNGPEGAVSVWYKTANAGVWTDATSDRFFIVSGDSNNTLFVGKHENNNTTQLFYKANGTLTEVRKASQVSTDWIHYAMRWSDANNLVEYFINGLEVSGQDAMNTTWNSTVDFSVIGASNVGGGYVANGWLAHVAVFNTPVSDAIMLGLGTPTA